MHIPHLYLDVEKLENLWNDQVEEFKRLLEAK